MLNTAKLLIEKGAQIEVYDIIGRSPLYNAIFISSWDTFEYLLGLGTDPLRLDKRGCNGLHYSARASSDDAVKTILKYGADANGVDSNGWSPLHWASASGCGSAKVIKTLLDAGSNKDLKDNQGRTALDLASLFGKDEDAAILRAAGQEYRDLPETNDGRGRDLANFHCDGCGDV